MTNCSIAIHVGNGPRPGTIVLGRKDGDTVAFDACLDIGQTDRVPGLAEGAEFFGKVTPTHYDWLLSLAKEGKAKVILLAAERMAIAKRHPNGIDLELAADLFHRAALSGTAIVVGCGAPAKRVIRALRELGWRTGSDTTLQYGIGAEIRLWGEHQPEPPEGLRHAAKWIVNATPNQEEAVFLAARAGDFVLVLDEGLVMREDVLALSPLDAVRAFCACDPSAAVARTIATGDDEVARHFSAPAADVIVDLISVGLRQLRFREQPTFRILAVDGDPES